MSIGSTWPIEHSIQIIKEPEPEEETKKKKSDILT